MGTPQNRIEGLLQEDLATIKNFTYTLWGNQKARDLKHFKAYKV